MRLLYWLAVLVLMLTRPALALVNGSAVSQEDWRSVVYIELTNPDSGRPGSCTGVIISSEYVITSASCVLNEETAKLTNKLKVCIGNQKPTKKNKPICLASNQIFTHHNFIDNSGTLPASDLAYIKFNKPIDLAALEITPAELITPDQFAKYAEKQAFPAITLVGFDTRKLSISSPDKKYQGIIQDAEFDYASSTIKLRSRDVRPGNHYQGLASFVQSAAGKWQLIGLVNHSNPDKLVTYYPEFNPCDENPIPVKYPSPIMQVETRVTAYPVAACNMSGFIASQGYSELACKKLLLRSIDWKKAIEKDNPAALRQKAMAIYNKHNSTDDAGEIYRLLYQSYQGGDNIAPIILARLLVEGQLLTKDYDTARQLLQQSLKNDHPEANLLMAKMMMLPTGNTSVDTPSETRNKQIFELLEKGANNGSVEAQYLLARFYQMGTGTDKSYTKAYHWYAMAAMQGYADAQYQLAMQWKDGRGMRAYPELSLFWIKQAAAQGQVDAQNQMGLLKPVFGK